MIHPSDSDVLWELPSYMKTFPPVTLQRGYALQILLWCCAIHGLILSISLSLSAYTCFRWYMMLSCNSNNKQMQKVGTSINNKGYSTCKCQNYDGFRSSVISIFCWFSGSWANGSTKPWRCTSILILLEMDPNSRMGMEKTCWNGWFGVSLF